MTKDEAKKSVEIETLNLDDLDVEELEQRMELAAAVPPGHEPTCGCNSDCFSNYAVIDEPDMS